MSLYYLDSSVGVAALLGDADAFGWFDATTADPSSTVLSSRLMQTELTRALRRERKSVSDRDFLLDFIEKVPVTEAILTAAEAITEHVKTLDAVHLATALALGSDVVVVSHDATMLRLAALFGLRTHDPLIRDGGVAPESPGG